MQLGDIYINKKDNSIIQIDSFATHMGKFQKPVIIIFRHLEANTDDIWSCPSFNGYGSQTEIESEYDLLIPYEKLNETTWEEALKSINSADVDKNEKGDKE